MIVRLILVAGLAAIAIACNRDDPPKGAARFCGGIASVERALDDVNGLDRNSSTADAREAHAALQDGYHDLVDGHTALQIFGPRTIEIRDISRAIEDLLELLRESADGEPVASQLSDIQRLSGDVASGAESLNEEADC